MKTSKRENIEKEVIKFLEEHPQGARYSEIINHLKNKFPNYPNGTIVGGFRNTFLQNDEIEKIGRGLFQLKKFQNQTTKQTTNSNIKEEDFYQPFADWLVNDIEECTNAIPLGGNLFQDKWGTPDVIGIRESKRSDIIQIPTEVVSAEIKTNTNQLITSFGQACSYKLFSHKVYLAIPKQSPQQDISRIDSLCLIFGIGLVLFDKENPNNPKFEIRARAIKTDPDIFYTNKYLKKIEGKLFK